MDCYKTRSTLFLILLLHAITALGQSPQIKYLSLKDGLSSQQAIDLVHDKHGFIWVATEMGLNRFASNSFKQYYKAEKADGLSVNSNEINALFYQNDQLYIGTRANGLNVYDMKTNRFSYYLHDDKDSNSIATNDITNIISSSSGKLWLSTYHRGVQRFDPIKKTFERFYRKNIPALAENSIWALAEDKYGLLYIGHVSKGLSILNTERRSVELITKNSSNGNLPDDEVKSLFYDKSDNIWIGTRKGLAVYHRPSKSIKKISLSNQTRNGQEPFIYSIKEIDGAIWIGAESSQVFILKPGSGSHPEIESAYNISSFYLNKGNNALVQQIDRDQFGNIWIAIYGGGIGFMSHVKPFFSIRSTQSLMPGEANPTSVSGILNDEDNSMWLATVGDGIFQVSDRGQVVHKTKRKGGLADDFLLSAFQDSQHNKWFGLQDGGVAFFDAGNKIWHKVDAREKMSGVRAIIEDSRGNICFAAEQGLFIHDPKANTFQKISPNKTMLGDYAIRTLVEDHHGNLWLGTYGQGLYIYNQTGKLIHTISKGRGINSNTINHLFLDRRNNIWIATNDGLAVQPFNRAIGTLEHLASPDQMPWPRVHALAEDRNGHIWCSTGLGLLRYLPKEKRFLSYDQAFGLPPGGFINASVSTDRQGNLYFGMPAGICYFDPKEIPLILPKSPIRISHFIVFNSGETNAQSVKYSNHLEEIQLQHNENSFRIELAVMDYAVHDMVEFSYQLHGLDNKWTFLGNEKNLDFRNIPHGDYELRIRTRQKNQNWSQDYKQLFIRISPPFYLSNLAIVLYTVLALSIIAAILFFHRKKVYAEAELRVKKMQLAQDQKLHMERMNFYTNITHELRTPLTLILGPLEELMEEQQLSAEHKNWVSMVQKNANRLFTMVNQLLDFRKVESQYKSLQLENGYLAELIKHTLEKYRDANTNENLSINFIQEQKDIMTRFDPEMVSLILDNLLSNAFKHTTSGRVEVQLSYEQQLSNTTAQICVKDTGCGIAEEHLQRIFDRYYQVPGQSLRSGTGVGLAVVRDLTAIHQGKIHVKSKPGHGSEFCVYLLTNAVSNTESPEAASSSPSPDAIKAQLPLLLLVEDEAELREYLTSILRSRYEVITANNGSNGLEIAKNRIPDLILSDVKMPDMDGFAMLEQLKQHRETSHIPIIFLTAKDTNADKEYGYVLGVDSYMTKPVSPRLLKRRIENLMMKRQALYAEVLAQLSAGDAAAQKPEPEANQELWRENVFVQEFVSLVEESMQHEFLDVGSLAERMNMSQSTLYRKLKGLTGKNINQLIRKIRMQKAAQLLRSGQYNVTEVAFMIGINNSLYFRQSFKEEFGELPSHYQKKTH